MAMKEDRIKEIEKSAEEIVEAFVRASEGLPSLEETYYAHLKFNVMRPDKRPSQDKGDFRERFLLIAPARDESGNLKVEAAKWVK
jgi:predicted Asp-tRNA(Asn)/Glu-tRNA(Gln) amidotransferase subunit C